MYIFPQAQKEKTCIFSTKSLAISSYILYNIYVAPSIWVKNKFSTVSTKFSTVMC